METKGSFRPGWRGAQFACGFDVSNEATPAADGLFLSRCGHDQQADIALTADRVAVLDATREENESAAVQLKRLLSTPEGECTLEHIEDLVFRWVSVVGRLFPATSDALHDRQTSAWAKLTCFNCEVDANVVVGPTLPCRERVRMHL